MLLFAVLGAAVAGCASTSGDRTESAAPPRSHPVATNATRSTSPTGTTSNRDESILKAAGTATACPPADLKISLSEGDRIAEVRGCGVNVILAHSGRWEVVGVMKDTAPNSGDEASKSESQESP
jgi:hypothetical protein